MQNDDNHLRIENPYYKLKYLFALLGANSIIVQVVLFRELFVTFSGNELSWGIFFATWLLSCALGSYLFTTIKLELKNKRLIIYLIFVFGSLLFFTEIIVARIIKTKLGFQPNEIIPIETIFLLTGILIFLPSFIFGALFTIINDLATEIIKENKSRVAGMVYAYEAFGFFLGGIFFSFFLITFFTSIEIFIGFFLLNLIYGYLLLHEDFLLSEKAFYIIQRKLFLKFIILAIVSISTISFLVKSDVFKNISDYSYKTQWHGFDFIKQVDSKFGKITVIEKDEQYNFFQNNNLSFILPDTAGAEQRIHLIMSLHDRPRKILMFGGISEEIKELFKYPIEKITYVEIDPVLVETVANYISYDDSLYFKDNRIETVFTDVREFVNTTDEKYDVIILNSEEPNTLFSNRYFTSEFYEQINDRLEDHGIFSFSVSSSPHYLSGAMYFMQSSIYQTLAITFPHIKLLSSDSLTFIASGSDEMNSADEITVFDRFLSRDLNNIYFTEYHLLDLITNERNEKREALLKSEQRKIINTDFNPKTYLLNIMLLGETADSYTTKIFKWLFIKENKDKVIYFFALFASIILIYHIVRFNKNARLDLYIMVFSSGFVAISMEILLLLLFQVLFGHVYYKIGLLIAVFMLGLFSGSRLGNSGFIHDLQKRFHWMIVCIETIFLLYLIVTYNLFLKTYLGTLSNNSLYIYALLFFVSFLAGIEYPVANSLIISKASKSPERSLFFKTGGRLYAFDLFGSCMGSLMFTLFFIPFFGLHKAFTFLIMIKAYSLLFIMTGKLLRRE